MEILYDIIIIAVFILAAYLLIKLISAPLKLIFKILLNALMGLITLFLFNIIGSFVGFTIDINFISALIAGIFGFPGVVVLAVLKLLF